MTRKILFLILLLCLSAGLTACSFILGADDGNQASVNGLNIHFVETLRNQASLQGESFRDSVTAGDPLTTLQQPGSVYADQFRVYVMDNTTPARIFIFDRGERTAGPLALSSISSSSTEGNLLAPGGIAVDATGLIYVSDSQQGRIFGYDRTGKLLVVVGRAGDIAFPTGIAVDAGRNRLYAADKHAQQIRVFAGGTGTHLFDLGSTGKASARLPFPSAVAVDRAGYVYAVDSQQLMIYVFEPEGNLLRKFSMKSKIPGRSISPKGIAVDSDGHLYVPDGANNNILVFTAEGSLIFTWGRAGTLFGDFWSPSGIFIDPQDRIYVADRVNGRVQVFQYTR